MAVDAGHTHTCARTATQDSWCFGHNSDGELGDGSQSPSHLPVQTLGAINYDTIVAGGTTTCGLSGGLLYCWGNTGISSANITTNPAQQLAGVVSDVSMSSAHRCAVRTDNALYCVGSNASGQLGIDPQTLFDPWYPLYNVPVDNSMDWSRVAAGTGFTCATRTDGTLWCWGATDCDGTPGASHIPAQVGTDNDWTDVHAASGFFCAEKQNGTVSCCGNNDHGQLGNGTTNPANTMTPVAGNHTFTHFDVGNSSACGVRTDGTLWCSGFYWGATPTQLGSANNWTDVGTGSGHVCALAADGTLWCQGSSHWGQAGKWWIQPSPEPVTL